MYCVDLTFITKVIKYIEIVLFEIIIYLLLGLVLGTRTRYGHRSIELMNKYFLTGEIPVDGAPTYTNAT